VDDARLGTALRKLRFERGWTQAELATRAGVSRSLISTLEAGRLATVGLRKLRRVSQALDAHLAIYLRWRGGELDRLLNRRHSAMHEAMARLFLSLPGWLVIPEASYNVYGERGIVDIFAWHEPRHTVLVIELKTEIVDVQELIGRVDQKRRLARRIAADRGFKPERVAAWVVVAESRTNRRRLAAHRLTLRTAFPTDGRRVLGWLREPDTEVAVLSFLSNVSDPGLRTAYAVRKRVRPVRSRSAPSSGAAR
jgi:transcriptional regulator with XRE-family HTH domain